MIYNAEIRGFLSYYALADNLTHVVGKILWLTSTSFFRTLANKRRSTINKVAKSLKQGPERYVISVEKGVKETAVDIGKFRHVAGFLSRTLLARHERFEGCPTLAFEQSREGFRSFVDHLREYTPLEQVIILLEHTGYCHRLLEQYLLALDITVYRVHVQKRADGMLKTDKRDALNLASTLYTQLELGAQVQDKMQTANMLEKLTTKER